MLKTKCQVVETFQKFHAMVERETERKLKCLRSDNGGDYTLHEFENYCSQHGIQHMKIVPGTPQHNDVLEKMNKTIVEKVRCMLKMSDLPKSFWAKAVKTAVYLINRSPSIPLGLDIPERTWKECDPTYSHLRVFGCKTYMDVPKEQRLKHDSNTTLCVFVGYGDEEYGFRLYDPEKQKVVRSKDVVFFEHEMGAELLRASQHMMILMQLMMVLKRYNLMMMVMYHSLMMLLMMLNQMMKRFMSRGEQPISPVDDVQIRRSTRDRTSSTKYPNTDYILVTDEGSPRVSKKCSLVKIKIFGSKL